MGGDLTPPPADLQGGALRAFTLDEVAQHCTWDDCWIVVQDIVYDLTPHVQNHEGWLNGSKQTTLLAILSAMGQDCTEDFTDVHSSRAWAQLRAFQIGLLHPPNRSRRRMMFYSWDQLVQEQRVPVDAFEVVAREGSVPSAPIRLTLSTLPAQLLQHILAIGGLVRSADVLSCTSRCTCEAVSAMGAAVLPSFSPPDWSASCSPTVVHWDAASGALRKTNRFGHALITFSECLRARDAFLQLDVTSLPHVGSVQLGLRGYERQDARLSRCLYNVWLDGAGRIHVYADINRPHATRAIGERVREGDRIGIAFLASTHAVGFLLNGSLMGPPIPLPVRCGLFRFVLRFDHVPDAAVSLVRTDGASPLDLSRLLVSAEGFTPRPPLDAEEQVVLVRTVGPDSKLHDLRVDVDRTSVAEFVTMVAARLGCEGQHVDLKLNGQRLIDSPHGVAGMDASEEAHEGGRVTLRDLGLRGDRCQLHDVVANVSHLIS